MPTSFLLCWSAYVHDRALTHCLLDDEPYEAAFVYSPVKGLPRLRCPLLRCISQR